MNILRKYKKLLLSLSTVIILFFIIRNLVWFWLYEIFQDIEKVTISYSFFIAIIIYIGLIFLLNYLRLLLLWVNLTTSFTKKWLKIWLISRISRYIPWKIWLIAIKVWFLVSEWFSKTQAWVISLYENIFQVVLSFVISISIFFLIDINYTFNNPIYIYIFIWLIVSFLLFPNFYFWILNYLLKKVWKSEISNKYFMSRTELVKFFVLYAIAIILNWTFLYFFIEWIWFKIWYLEAVWIRNFAGVIGLLAVFVPWWLWVREWVLTVLLEPYIWIWPALSVWVLSRITLTLVDIWLLLVIWVWSVKSIFKSQRKLVK